MLLTLTLLACTSCFSWYFFGGTHAVRSFRFLTFWPIETRQGSKKCDRFVGLVSFYFWVFAYLCLSCVELRGFKALVQIGNFLQRGVSVWVSANCFLHCCFPVSNLRSSYIEDQTHITSLRIQRKENAHKILFFFLVNSVITFKQIICLSLSIIIFLLVLEEAGQDVCQLKTTIWSSLILFLCIFHYF